MDEVTKDLLEAIEELVAEFGVCGLTEKARAAIARAEAALSEPQPDAESAMTRADVLRLALEAGFTWEPINNIADPLERFAALVAAAEREACSHEGWMAASSDCEDRVKAAIRARGQK